MDKMEPNEILAHTRKLINACAGNDPDKWFYTNRFVYARLQLDERKPKARIKKKLLDSDKTCFFCKEPFYRRERIDLHRLDDKRGYSFNNCVLVHPDCHKKYHAKNPSKKRQNQSTNNNQRKKNLLGEVILRWETARKPNWNIEKTIRICIDVDKEFEKEHCNTAPKFREARKKNNRSYMRRWILGCHFSWINPR